MLVRLKDKHKILTLSVPVNNDREKLLVQQTQWIMTHTTDCSLLLLHHDLTKVIPSLSLKDLQMIRHVIRTTNEISAQFEGIYNILSSKT